MATKKRKASAKELSNDEAIDRLVCKFRPVVELYETFPKERKEELQYYLKSLFYSALSSDLPVKLKIKFKAEFMQTVRETIKSVSS